MKKLLFVFAIAAIGSLASCKKEYTCTCTIYDANGDKITSASDETDKMKKSEAEDECDKGDSEVAGVGKTECEID